MIHENRETGVNGVGWIFRAPRKDTHSRRFSGPPTIERKSVGARPFPRPSADGGTPIGQFDTMIAAHALALGAVLVTNNRKHFRQVKTLMLENWYV